MAEETTTAPQAPERIAEAMPSSDAPVTPTPSQDAQPADNIQPFIDTAYETIQHEVESLELGKFLRAHVKTFRQEWDAWSTSAKDAYIHMMASQLLQRKAAAKQIAIGNAFKLPEPSAQTTLFESIQHSQIKPKKCTPVLLLPPNLRPTYSLKK